MLLDRNYAEEGPKYFYVRWAFTVIVYIPGFPEYKLSSGEIISKVMIPFSSQATTVISKIFKLLVISLPETFLQLEIFQRRYGGGGGEVFLEILTWRCFDTRLSSIWWHRPGWTLKCQGVGFGERLACVPACQGVQHGTWRANVPFHWALADRSQHVIQACATWLTCAFSLFQWNF